MLGGQQVRLDQGARPWNSAVSADTGGVLYRKWRQKEERQKPWFASFAQNADNIVGQRLLCNVIAYNKATGRY